MSDAEPVCNTAVLPQCVVVAVHGAALLGCLKQLLPAETAVVPVELEAEVLTISRQLRPDVVVLDSQAPDYDSLALAQALVDDLYLTGLRVLLLAASSQGYAQAFCQLHPRMRLLGWPFAGEQLLAELAGTVNPIGIHPRPFSVMAASVLPQSPEPSEMARGLAEVRSAIRAAALRNQHQTLSSLAKNLEMQVLALQSKGYYTAQLLLQKMVAALRTAITPVQMHWRILAQVDQAFVPLLRTVEHLQQGGVDRLADVFDAIDDLSAQCGWNVVTEAGLWVQYHAVAQTHQHLALINPSAIELQVYLQTHFAAICTALHQWLDLDDTQTLASLVEHCEQLSRRAADAYTLVLTTAAAAAAASLQAAPDLRSRALEDLFESIPEYLQQLRAEGVSELAAMETGWALLALTAEGARPLPQWSRFLSIPQFVAQLPGYIPTASACTPAPQVADYRMFSSKF